jgi:hypothetical protein
MQQQLTARQQQLTARQQQLQQLCAVGLVDAALQQQTTRQQQQLTTRQQQQLPMRPAALQRQRLDATRAASIAVIQLHACLHWRQHNNH